MAIRAPDGAKKQVFFGLKTLFQALFYWVKIFTFVYGQGQGAEPPPLTVKYPFFTPYLL